MSGAVITGDVAISVGKRAVYAIDLRTGEEAWRLVRNGGPLSVPAVGVAGGRQILVFVDEAPISGIGLVGVELGNRRELWRAPLGARSSSGVSIDGTQVFVGDDRGRVHAVDLRKGTPLWTAKTSGEILTPPAVSDGRVYVVSHDTDARQSELAAFDESTGRKSWPAYSAPVAGAAGCGAAAADGGVVAGFTDRYVRKLSADGGVLRWEELALSFFSPANMPALGGGDVYIADVSGGLYRLDGETGSRVWDYQFNHLVVRSSPVVSGSAVLLGLDDGRMVAVDARSGELVWQGRPGDGLIGAVALSQEVVVAVKGGRQPGLVAFVHDPGGTLTHIPSPTVIDAGALLGNFAVALAIVLVALLVSFRFLAPRWGLSHVKAGAREGGPTGGKGVAK
ncbi:MAG: PQQ-binding-like beta-propeller repeat protein [Actinomycetota bacterium]